MFYKNKNPDKPTVYRDFCVPIISYQEQLGNYNAGQQRTRYLYIISYQEQFGKYNVNTEHQIGFFIISYQERLKNYNPYMSKKLV